MNKSWSKDFFPIRTSCCLSNTSFRADKSLLASITITGGRSYLSWNRFSISQSSWHRCNSYLWDMKKKCVLIYHLFLLNWIIFDIIRCSQWLPASIATALGPPQSDIAWPFWRARPLDPFGGRQSSRQLGHSLRLLAIDHPRQGVRWQPSSQVCDSTQRNKTCCCRSISRWFWYAGNLADRILSEKIDATS